MATLTPQFKIKRSLEWGEFASGVCKFLKVNVPAKHKNTTCKRNSETIFVGDCTKRKHFSWWKLVLRARYWVKGVLPAFILGSVLLCPVVGRSRPAVVACCTVRSGVFHHWIHHLWPQGAFPPGFNPLRRGWVYRPAPEAPRKGECRRGPRHFWNCLSRWATALRQDPP